MVSPQAQSVAPATRRLPTQLAAATTAGQGTRRSGELKLYTPRAARAFQRDRAFSRSCSRVLTIVWALNEPSSLCVAVATSSTARSKAAASAAEALARPLTFRTYWTAAEWISSFVVGGSKL